MGLPTGGGPWPPPPHGLALAQQALWSAWYIGDPESLSGAYSLADPGIGSASTDFFRYENGHAGNLAQGGLVNRVARYFWSRPSLSNQRKSRLHVPLAADIATASADLLFSEPPQFTVEEGGNEKAAERVDDILNDGSFHAAMLEASEFASALGGAWLRLVWDTEIADHVMVNAVAADAAIGEWTWGKLTAVTFFTEYSKGSGNQEVVRHLERYEPGMVYHGLYKGDAKSLGTAVPLVDHPSTALYAELVDDAGAIPTGVKTILAAYVANMRPQRRWRKLDVLAQLGRSDYDGVEPLMDALDETYTSWMRDVRLGKARIIVPENMLKDLGKGKGAAWDEDQEVFTALKESLSDDKITPQQFSIRVAEHQQTAAQLVDEILCSSGYSPSTFGKGGDGQLSTATEVVSRERQSARTRDKKARYWTQALEPLLTTWLELDALIFKTGAVGSVEVEWPDEAQADPLTLAQTADTLRRAQAASTKTLVAMQHPDWDEAAIDEEVALVLSEAGSMVPDVGPLPFDTQPATLEASSGLPE